MALLKAISYIFALLRASWQSASFFLIVRFSEDRLMILSLKIVSSLLLSLDDFSEILRSLNLA
jgi:hypothetical protein